MSLNSIPKKAELSSGQTIFRAVKQKRYVTIDNRPLSDPQLSWKAKGLLAYILTLPDNWNIREEELTRHSTDRMHSTRTAIKELIKAGHIIRRRRPNTPEGGYFAGWEYLVYESPQKDKPPLCENRIMVDSQPLCDYPIVDNPIVDNHTLPITHQTNNPSNQLTIYPLYHPPKDDDEENKYFEKDDTTLPLKAIVNYLESHGIHINGAKAHLADIVDQYGWPKVAGGALVMKQATKLGTEIKRPLNYLAATLKNEASDIPAAELYYGNDGQPTIRVLKVSKAVDPAPKYQDPEDFNPDAGMLAEKLKAVKIKRPNPGKSK